MIVRGGVLHVGDLRISLKDIGYDTLYIAIDDAVAGIDIYKNHVKDS